MKTPFIDKFIENLSLSLPTLIWIILSVAFISMLIVTIWTILAMRKAENEKKVVNLPPSALLKEHSNEEKIGEGNTPPPLGESLNKLLIGKGYIRVHNIVRSFFKSMDFLKKMLGSDYKYKLPWFMIVGSSNSGKSSLLSGFTHDEIFDNEEEGMEECTWWFLKSGVVIDIKGEIFLPEKGLKAKEDSWNIVLNMLARYRGARPLNGIMLTIPANELYGKNRLAPDDIKARAQFVARKLNFTQNFLGMKLPVYVVITKTDLIPGFQSFCSEIPVRNRNNILGWSCPYSLESVYVPRWIDEAFDSIEDELNEIRMEIFSESGATTTRDGIFVFPSELLTIKESLRIYTDYIFSSVSIEEKLYFRGIYFTGDSKMVPLLQFSGAGKEEDMAIMGTPDADLNEEGVLTASLRSEEFAPKKIFFFEDLLLKKVFLEEGIASPMRNKVYQSNKTILAAKISTAVFVVVGSYGLFQARNELRLNRDLLYPSLFKVSSIIKDATYLTIDKLNNNGNEVLSEYTNQLFIMMRQLNSIRFSSVFVPASWFSTINKKLIETLRVSYQRVVVRTIYMNLILKARILFNTNPVDHVSKSIREVLNPYKSCEYNAMKNYVNDLIELDKNIKKFDSLRSSGDLKDLSDLVDYTFQGSLPDEFLDNFEQFRHILINTPFPPINLSPYKKVAYDTLIGLFQNFIEAIFSDRKGSSIAYFLHNFIDTLSKQNIKKIPDCDKIIAFSKGLSEACREIGNEGETWLDSETFKNDVEYNKFLDGVEVLFGKETAQSILDITANKFEDLKLIIKEFNALLQNDIPNRNIIKKEENLPLSHGIFMMEKCLAVLCKAPYMQKPENYTLVVDVPEGKMVYWDDELIQYACEISKNFEQFFTSSIKDFPRAMQEGVTLMAQNNLYHVIAGIVAKAESFVDAPSAMTDELTSEEILERQVYELKNVAPKFMSLLNILRLDKLNFVFSDLRIILNKIGFSMLSHIDKILDNQKPYMPKSIDFSYWDGNNGAGYLAYSINDADDMKNYILLQRKLITRLAINFAEPIVQLLNSDVVFDQNFGNHGQLMKWTKIVDEAKRLKSKDPTCIITVVEKLIQKKLNSYNLDNITTEISLSDTKGESSNYFLNIIKQIKRGILARAEVLIRQRSIKRYNLLKNFYDKKLDNKYPFVDYDKTERLPPTEANVEEVRDFFHMYDNFGGTPEKILDQIYQLEEEGKSAFNFLKKIHVLRQFFENFVDRDYEMPKVRLEIDFNVNKKSEENTSYLIDRIFKPNGESNIEFISEAKTAIWYFGTPIQMTLRWAGGNDPDIEKPIADPNDPDLIIDGNTISIECIGNWSVLRFLQKYKVNIPGNNPNQSVLLFRVPLNNSRRTSVYVGITASTAVSSEEESAPSLVIPQNPGKMPELPSGIISLANSSVIVENSQLPYSEIEIVKEREPSASEMDEKTKQKPVNGIEEENEQKLASLENRTINSEQEEAMNILRKDNEIFKNESEIEILEEPIE